MQDGSLTSRSIIRAYQSSCRFRTEYSRRETRWHVSAAQLLCSAMPSSSIEDRYSFNRVRNRALKELAKLIIVPPILLNALTRSTQIRLGYWTVPCYGLAIFLGAYARTWYHDYFQARDAKFVAGEKTIGTIPR